MRILNRWLLSFLTAVIFGACFAVPASAAPYISSDYYCLMDRSSSQLILSKNADTIRPVASTTKMMTSIITVEYAGLEEVAEVSRNADNTPEFTIGLRTGQKISVAELLKATLIRSSNDAAVVLAEHVAGEEALFAHLMSKKAFLLGCFNTHFVNASGLPADGHYSTAYDLALIGRYLLASDYISELVATKQAEFKHPAYRQSITITNTNGLLGSYPGADGIKTGTTNAAGKCLVASASRKDRQLIAVVLKSSDRIGDCTRLLDYGFQASSLKKIVDSKLPFKRLKLINGEDLYIDIYPEEDVFLWEGEGSPDVQKKVRLNYQPEAPVQKGQKIGCLGVYADGKLLENVPLVCKKSVRKTNLVKKLFQVFLSR